MTAVVEDTTVEGTEDTKGATASSDADDDEDSKSRDFSKFTKKHGEIADFINQNEDYNKAELPQITGNIVKAVLALRTDFNDTPEQKAAREERKREREEQKKKFEGLDPEQVKAEKAALRAEAQAKKLEDRVAAALAKAKALREGKDASGEDIAAAVEADQSETDSEDKPKPRIGRAKR